MRSAAAQQIMTMVEPDVADTACAEPKDAGPPFASLVRVYGVVGFTAFAVDTTHRATTFTLPSSGFVMTRPAVVPGDHDCECERVDRRVYLLDNVCECESGWALSRGIESVSVSGCHGRFKLIRTIKNK